MTAKVYQPGESYSYPLILKQLLTTPLIYSPDQEIVYRDKYRGTYRTLHERINRLANGLTRLGVKPGDVVAVFDFDSHRYLECFFGIPGMGATLQTVNWRLSPEQVVYTINHAEAKAVIVNSTFLPLLQGIRDKLTTVKTVILIAEDGRKPETALALDADYEELLGAADTNYPFPDLDENTRATTFYTTGTTGNPKGVYFTHRQLMLHTLASAVAVGSYHTLCRFRSNDVYMPLTPMFHVHAWGIPYVATLLGVKQVYPGMYEPGMILKLIQTEKVTFSHCVPTILQMILTSPAAQNADLSHWKCIIGGSQLPRGLAKMARDRGIDVIVGYGMSETCPIISLATPREEMLDWEGERLLDVVTKTGRPIPLAEVDVFDPMDRPLPARRQGRRRGGHAHPLADGRVSQGPGAVGRALALGLAAQRGCGPHRPAGLHPDHRSHQGRDQERRGVDLLPGSGEPAEPARGGAGIRRRRRQRREMGRAAPHGGRPETGVQGQGHGRGTAAVHEGVRRPGPAAEIRRAGTLRIRRRHPQDERRQTEQAGDPAATQLMEVTCKPPRTS